MFPALPVSGRVGNAPFPAVGVSSRGGKASFPPLAQAPDGGNALFPTLGEAPKASETAPKDSFEGAAIHPDLGDGYPVSQKDRYDIGEALPKLRLGVDVAQRVGKAVGRKHFVEQDRHLIAEMATGAGGHFITGEGSGTAEEHAGHSTKLSLIHI